MTYCDPSVLAPYCNNERCRACADGPIQSGIEPEMDELMEKEQEALAAAHERGKTKERAAWVRGERCRNCGAPMEPDPLAEMCGQCYQEE
jgi:hypothetical protein